jgi:hypothetical protein
VIDKKKQKENKCWDFRRKKKRKTRRPRKYFSLCPTLYARHHLNIIRPQQSTSSLACPVPTTDLSITYIPLSIYIWIYT